ncbi:MAG: acetolactate synthase AlsS [Planctomycetota bacterium]|nr:acetolactate synthase AlsS [Planctomycetota bacterium]
MFKKEFEGPNGAEFLVRCLEGAGITHAFGIPGAKIDPVFEALHDSSIELIVCRHEQNAGFMAAAMGRMTGQIQACIGTSGPGTSNFCTALITATTEGDPVLCLSGAVPLRMRHQQTHQSMDNVSLMRPVTKWAMEATSSDAIGELVAAACRAAQTPRPGAAYLSLPYDVMLAPASGDPLCDQPPDRGGAADADILQAAERIAMAKMPVLLAGAASTAAAPAEAIRALLRHRPLPIVGTWEAAGLVPRDKLDCFFGRVGLFRNQPGDRLLAAADLVITLGFEQVEYDPATWNVAEGSEIVHIHDRPADFDQSYQPSLELVGDLATTVTSLSRALPEIPTVEERPGIANLRADVELNHQVPEHQNKIPLHPLSVIAAVREVADEDSRTTVVCDVGSHYIWMGRHFYCYEPRRLLFSNGQQTLGVALPWAIAACLARPGEPVISMSGDGGFLFSSQELETAVRLGCNFTHLIWRDGSYDMVAFQQEAKYGRSTAVRFGDVDPVRYAESFGATGFRVEHHDELGKLIRLGQQTPGPVLIDVPVDYSQNEQLMATLQDDPRSH